MGDGLLIFPRTEGKGLPLLRATGEVPHAEQFTDHLNP